MKCFGAGHRDTVSQNHVRRVDGTWRVDRVTCGECGRVFTNVRARNTEWTFTVAVPSHKEV